MELSRDDFSVGVLSVGGVLYSVLNTQHIIKVSWQYCEVVGFMSGSQKKKKGN